jgi:hypothetical protein
MVPPAGRRRSTFQLMSLPVDHLTSSATIIGFHTASTIMKVGHKKGRFGTEIGARSTTLPHGRSPVLPIPSRWFFLQPMPGSSSSDAIALSGTEWIAADGSDPTESGWQGFVPEEGLETLKGFHFLGGLMVDF